MNTGELVYFTCELPLLGSLVSLGSSSLAEVIQVPWIKKKRTFVKYLSISSFENIFECDIILKKCPTPSKAKVSF